jgi:hypothetical protein
MARPSPGPPLGCLTCRGLDPLAKSLWWYVSEDCVVHTVMGSDLSLPFEVTDAPTSDSSEDTVMPSTSASSWRSPVGLRRSVTKAVSKSSSKGAGGSLCRVAAPPRLRFAWLGEFCLVPPGRRVWPGSPTARPPVLCGAGLVARPNGWLVDHPDPPGPDPSPWGDLPRSRAPGETSRDGGTTPTL